MLSISKILFVFLTLEKNTSKVHELVLFILSFVAREMELFKCITECFDIPNHNMKMTINYTLGIEYMRDQ